MTTTHSPRRQPFRPLRIRALPRDGRTPIWKSESASVKEQMGESLLILGHHYQQDEVIRFADLRGDSFKLIQARRRKPACRAIVFCGVHFMAETADILSREEVERLPARPGRRMQHGRHGRPRIGRGRLARTSPTSIDIDELMPVTYVNSSADLKAFCGRHGGIVCTSSNARAVLEWAFARRSRVLFFPDQHLGPEHGPGAWGSLSTR